MGNQPTYRIIGRLCIPKYPPVINSKFVLLTTGSEQASGTPQFDYGNDAAAF